MAAESAQRICFVHIGTHKTGTTSLQNVLAQNAGILHAAGLYVPRAGRYDAASGHHNLAWELNEDRRFDAARGTVSDVLAEIARQEARHACLSSEDFEYLHSRPQALRTLAGGLRAIGYDPVVVAYLRPQADYAESLYAELVRHGLADPFEVYLAAIIAGGTFHFNGRWRFAFDYERLLDDFAGVFGAHCVIARRYAAGAGDVVADFLQLVGADAATVKRCLVRPARLHASLQFGQVIRGLEQNAGSADGPIAALPAERGNSRSRFDPVHVSEVRRIVARFNAGNRRVFEKYGVRVPCVSGRELVADVVAALGANPASSYRKRLVDAHAAAHGVAVPLPAQSRSPAEVGRVSRPIVAPEFRRPALLEAAIFTTAASVACATFVYGSRTASTALLEFGMLSAIVAISAVALLARYAVESRGIIADDRYFDAEGARLSLIGYGAVGGYALINALLDVAVKRYGPDWISYPGTVAAAAAALILTLILPARRRLADGNSAPRDGDERHVDRLYLACCYVILLGQLGHAVSPVWWLDTTIDIFVVVLAGLTAYQIGRASWVPAGARA